MSKKFKETKPDFSIVHDIAVAFASARIIDYKYPDDIDSNDLRQYRYANFLTDYAYEDNESGRDAGIRSVGYKLYLYEDSGNNVSSLPCPAHAIYQLLNAVQSCIAKSESDAEKFIDTYLSQN